MSRHVRLHSSRCSKCICHWKKKWVQALCPSSSLQKINVVSYLFQRDRSITDLVLKGKINFSLLYYVDFRRRSFGEAQALCPSLSLQMLTVVSKLMQLCSSIIGLVLRRWSEIRIPSLLYHVDPWSTEVRAKSLKRFALCVSANRLLEEIKFLCLSLSSPPPGKRVIIHSSPKNVPHSKQPSFEGSTRNRHFVKDPRDAFWPMLLPVLFCQSRLSLSKPQQCCWYLSWRWLVQSPGHWP